MIEDYGMYDLINNNEEYSLISEPTIVKDEYFDIKDDTLLEDSEKTKEYPIRCPDCWESSRLSANMAVH